DHFLDPALPQDCPVVSDETFAHLGGPVAQQISDVAQMLDGMVEVDDGYEAVRTDADGGDQLIHTTPDPAGSISQQDQLGCQVSPQHAQIAHQQGEYGIGIPQGGVVERQAVTHLVALVIDHVNDQHL